ncbi:MAG: glycosyltransferase [Candidatus Sulfotelmatobacter sp.]
MAASFWHRLERGAIGISIVGFCLLVLIELRYSGVITMSVAFSQYEARRTLVLLAIFPSILLCCCATKGFFYNLLNVFELRWLGNISYSFYLTHTIGINAYRLIVLRYEIVKAHPYATLLLSFPLVFVLSLAVAVIFFALVEKRYSLPQRHASPLVHARSSVLAGHAQGRNFTFVKGALALQRDVTLSVVIPGYNTAKYVNAAVNSVLAQSYAQLEVIVVDDGSTDDWQQELESISDPRVTIVMQANRGLAGCRNTGILLARGKYIGFLDADDVWYREKAEKQLAAMDADPTIGVTFSYSAYLDEDGTPSGQFLISRCKQPKAQDLALRNHIGNGSNPILRRECFEEAGLFAEELRSCEDYEMWVRIAACTQWKVRLIPEVLTGYRVRPGSMTSSYEIFTGQARIAIERIRQYLPELSTADAARCYAESLRIAGRKALSNGNIKLSRALLLDALRHCPWLPFVDIRAAGLFLIHLLSFPLPRRCKMSIYKSARAVTRTIYLAFESNLRAQRGGLEP